MLQDISLWKQTNFTIMHGAVTLQCYTNIVPVNYYYNDHVDHDVLNTDMYDHRKGKIASITCNLSSNMKPTLLCKNKITKRKIIYSSKDV